MFSLSGSRFGFFLRKNLSVVGFQLRGFRLAKPSCDRQPVTDNRQLITVYLAVYALFFGLIGPFSALSEEGTAPVQLEKIVVTPGRFTIYDGASAKISLSKQEIERFPLIDNDVMRAGHIFPGVASSDYSTRFSVRGGEKDDISVRLDGMELYNPYHLQDFGGAVSLIGLGLIQNTNLLIGGFPAEYGEKMSGVFDITTRTPNAEKFSANFGVDLINATATLEGPLSKKGVGFCQPDAGILISFSRSWILTRTINRNTLTFIAN